MVWKILLEEITGTIAADAVVFGNCQISLRKHHRICRNRCRAGRKVAVARHKTGVDRAGTKGGELQVAARRCGRHDKAATAAAAAECDASRWATCSWACNYESHAVQNILVDAGACWRCVEHK